MLNDLWVFCWSQYDMTRFLQEQRLAFIRLPPRRFPGDWGHTVTLPPLVHNILQKNLCLVICAADSNSGGSAEELLGIDPDQNHSK